MHVARKHASARSARAFWQLIRFQSSTSNQSREGLRRQPADLPRDIIFSGIQPTGIPHLGNYLGALRQWKELQDDSNRKSDFRYFSIVDLHALTLYQDPATLLRWRRETMAALLAIGLLPEKSAVFFQSEVPSHAELMWILSTIASTGYLSRMTQWKSKLDLQEDASLDTEAARAKLRLGLFSYPVLQAADILLYRSTHVPVGEDQAQHIEFARNLASSFNHLYSNSDPVLVVPQPLISPAKRIMSLKTPTSKMSKSDPNPASRILITDDRATIHSKFKTALTDSEPGISYNPARRSGVSNLIEILRHSSRSEQSCEALAADLQGLSMKAFKEHVADAVVACLDGVGERFAALTQTKEGYDELLRAQMDGKALAVSRAGCTINRVRKAVGLEAWEDGAA